MVVSGPENKTHEDDEDKFSTISSEEIYPQSKPSSEESLESDSDTDLVEVFTTISVARIKQNPGKKQKTIHPFCDKKIRIAKLEVSSLQQKSRHKEV